MTILDDLRDGFEGRLELRERRPGVQQVILPIFHEDGDMIDMFLDQRGDDRSQLRIHDAGLTLMRLSYNFDLDTPNKQKILQKILSENSISLEDGVMSTYVSPQSVFPAVMNFAQVVAKVSSLTFLKRQVISSLFYEMLGDFIKQNLRQYEPEPDYIPLTNRPELEVDWKFALARRPIYLFGVKDRSKARLATISCLQFQNLELPFRSVVVHENFEADLAAADQRIITSAADKQFISLADFQEHGKRFFAREAAA